MHEHLTTQFSPDTPDELPMNYFNGVIQHGAFQGDGFSLPLPQQVETLGEGRPVVMAIRPEHVGLSADGIEARLERVEPLYREQAQILYAAFGNVRCIAKVFIPRRIGITYQVALYFDPEALLFFDPSTGERLV
ncbi:MAG: hypothetical protein U0401_09340 [Anaerolineae bacterium]